MKNRDCCASYHAASNDQRLNARSTAETVDEFALAAVDGKQGFQTKECTRLTSCLTVRFETLELDKIRICTKRSNTASRILAEKMGFVQVPSFCKDSIVFCMQKGYNNLYTK